LFEKVPRPIAFIPEQSNLGRMERHKAIVRLIKLWAWRVGEPGYAVTLSEALADHIIEVVIDNDLLSEFDPPDDPQALKRRALERAQRRQIKKS
jgi:hypothetical protein